MSHRMDGRSPGGNGGRASPSRLLSLFGLGVFAAFLLVSAYVFVNVQILPPGGAWLAPLIPFRGHYGEDQALAGVNYTELLEISGFLSMGGLGIFKFFRTGHSSIRQRILVSFALPLKVFGLLIAAIVYTETHLLWGELWYGFKLVNINPQGFPWGNERVAYNLCFIHGSDYIPTYGSYCWLFNYDELLLVSVFAAFTGWLILRRYKSD